MRPSSVADCVLTAVAVHEERRVPDVGRPVFPGTVFRRGRWRRPALALVQVAGGELWPFRIAPVVGGPDGRSVRRQQDEAAQGGGGGQRRPERSLHGVV